MSENRPMTPEKLKWFDLATHKFNPGPWDESDGVVYSDNTRICECYHESKNDECDIWPTMDQYRANAALIAAAPELLEALFELLAERNYYAQRLAHETGITMSNHSGREAALAAIRKAVPE